ncbi:MAG: YceD family protein [Steroidobacteraceae bacterium]|jgi:uncharacterized protein|nr:YceD family protein [Steroidobacteraceae bacterium]
MSKPLANRLDAVRLAADSASLERRFPLAGFPRLADSLVTSEGDATARLSFLGIAEGVPGCELEVAATLALRCQRCLRAVDVPVRSAGRLAFVAGDADAARAPDDVEAVTCDPRAVDLHALVEDELLLSLPLVPRHENDDCGPREVARVPDESEDSRAATRPFAGLKDLLKH